MELGDARRVEGADALSEWPLREGNSQKERLGASGRVPFDVRARTVSECPFSARSTLRDC
jgi:hypothetical protein